MTLPWVDDRLLWLRLDAELEVDDLISEVKARVTSTRLKTKRKPGIYNA